ncbi:MAG: translation elongation factor 4 [Pseudomonadota bacterium]|nr:translation elongation factor 4 [Pseudomonadota bacterium]
MNPEFIRNFSIIAHVDHGKSTLADRLLEETGSLSDREMKNQVLDSMDIERERGITIKAQTASMRYSPANTQNNAEYLLNLIDTPGHVDFNYEVSRSLAACEGALVVIDSSQGVEAQTIANVELAMEHNLTLIPVINKIDLPNADVDKVREEMEDELAIDSSEAILVSAKTGVGIKELLLAIIDRIPPPQAQANERLQALIFDSWFDPFLGAISLVRLAAGDLRRGQRILMMSSAKTFEIQKLGILTPKPVEVESLACGEVGYICAAIKNITDTRVGDTITDAKLSAAKPLPGFAKAAQMVFGGIFPIDVNDYQLLAESLEKLQLNDSSITVEKVSSSALGLGFRAGFLGLLHLEIIQERLEREYNLALIFSAPSVLYQVVMKDNSEQMIENPASMPDPARIEMIKEPYVAVLIHTPEAYLGALIRCLNERRGIQIDLQYSKKERYRMHYEMPMSEMIFNFHDRLKSLSRGYASMDYKVIDYRPGDLVKLDTLVNGQVVDALSCIIHRQNAAARGRVICKKLKDSLPRQMFKIPIQAAVGAKVLARETISALRKDVTAKCYGGDITRKRKLLEKQKEGKKKLKMIGKVEIPQNAFLDILKLDDN